MKKLLIITALLIISVGLFSQNFTVSNKVFSQEALGIYWRNTISSSYSTLTSSRPWRITPITTFLGDSTLLKKLIATGSGLFKTTLSSWGNSYLGNSSTDSTFNSGVLKIGRGFVLNDNAINATTGIIDTVAGQIMDIGVKNIHSASLYNGIEITDLSTPGVALIGGGSSLMWLHDTYTDLYKRLYLHSHLDIDSNVFISGNSTLGDATNDVNTLNGSLIFTHTPEKTDPDSILVKDGNNIKATAVTLQDEMTGDLANKGTGMNVIYSDTTYSRGVYQVKIQVSLVDDATYSLPDSKSITGKAWTSTTADVIYFGVSTAGVPVSLCANGSTAVTDSDGTTICIVDSGTYAVIKNRSGGTLYFNITYEWGNL